MKLNKISLLCALACVGFAGQASAQLSGSATAAAIVANATAATNPSTAGGARIIYISGASAVQGGLGSIAATLFSGTSYYFTPSGTSGKSASDYRAYAGNLAAAAGGWPAGSAVILINRALGGSVQGVDPVARQQSIDSLAISSASCTAGSGTSGAPFLCNTLDSRVPDAGVSDVAPALFDDLYNTEGEAVVATKLSSSELASLTATPLYSLAFGVPVSNNLPLFNLTKSAVSAIMTGNVGTWDQVDASLPANDILLCRRTNGSGTQAVTNLYNGNYPCSTAANAPADRDSGSAWNATDRRFVVEGNTGALNVVEHAASGDVRTCLTNAAVASAAAFNASADPVTGVGYTSYTTADRAGASVTVRMRNGVTQQAIGVLSLDSLTASSRTPTAPSTGTGWSFRSLDGAGGYYLNGTAAAGSPLSTGTGRFPTVANLIDGTWDQQGIVSLNIPAATTGSKLAFINNFKAAATSPAVLNGLQNLKYVAASPFGTPNPTSLAQVQRVAYANNNQCAPLNRNN